MKKRPNYSRNNITSCLNGSIKSGTKHLTGVQVAPVKVFIMEGYNPPKEQIAGTVVPPDEPDHMLAQRRVLEALSKATQ